MPFARSIRRKWANTTVCRTRGRCRRLSLFGPADSPLRARLERARGRSLCRMVPRDLRRAVLLRLCLGPFGWTISLKAAGLTRLAGGLRLRLPLVGFIAAVFFAPSEAGDGQRVVTIGPGVLLVGGCARAPHVGRRYHVLRRTLAGRRDNGTAWTPPAPCGDPNARTIGGAKVYSADNFLTDTSRASRRAASADALSAVRCRYNGQDRGHNRSIRPTCGEPEGQSLLSPAEAMLAAAAPID